MIKKQRFWRTAWKPIDMALPVFEYVPITKQERKKKFCTDPDLPTSRIRNTVDSNINYCQKKRSNVPEVSLPTWG
jgi:hypothetical protein